MEKILYLSPFSNYGGAETFLKQSFRYKSSNFENQYLLFQTGPLGKELEDMGAKVFYLNAPPEIKKMQDRSLVTKKIKQLINENNYKLVHSTTSTGALFAAKACKMMGVYHVWFQHGPVEGWKDRVAAYLPHQGLIVNSHYTAQRQRTLENPLRFFIPRQIPIEKILMGTDEVNHPADEIKKYRNSLSDQHQFPSSHKIISMICRIEKQKGVHVLLDSLRQMSAMNMSEGYQVIVWGKTHQKDYLETLKKQVQEEGLPVLFPGRCESPSLALSASEIVVNASIQPESFGLTVIEGMMAGCVPVVPNEGGPVEVVSNGKNGMIFQARDSSSLAKNLKILLEDDELREKLSTHARQTAVNKFTAGRAIGHLESFHQRIIDNQGK